MITIIALVVGLLIGMTIDISVTLKINESNEKIIKTKDEIIQTKDEMLAVYENYTNELEEAYSNCQNGVKATIDENIELKKRLSKVEV